MKKTNLGSQTWISRGEKPSGEKVPLVCVYKYLVHYGQWAQVECLMQLEIKGELSSWSNICNLLALSLIVKGWLAPSSICMVGSMAQGMGVGMTSTCKSVVIGLCSSRVCGGLLPSSRWMAWSMGVETELWLVSTWGVERGRLFGSQIFNDFSLCVKVFPAFLACEREGLALGCTLSCRVYTRDGTSLSNGRDRGLYGSRGSLVSVGLNGRSRCAITRGLGTQICLCPS